MARILIIGGTEEARQLFAQLQAVYGVAAVTMSLAGVTQSAAAAITKCGQIIGPFGGADGLTAYLRAHGIEAMIDAAHPYASTMHAHVAAAAAQTQTPWLSLVRPVWPKQPGDRWHWMGDLAELIDQAAALAGRILLTHGRHVPPNIGEFERQFFLRSIEPVADLPANVTWLPAVLPLTLKAELDLLQSHEIGALTAKVSGGASTYAKIEAARRLGLPVVLLARPKRQSSECVATVADAVAWAAALFGRST